MADKTPEQQALELIRRAERARSTELDLSELGLKGIPSALWRLTHVRLHNNQLPSDAGQHPGRDRHTFKGAPFCS